MTRSRSLGVQEGSWRMPDSRSYAGADEFDLLTHTLLESKPLSYYALRCWLRVPLNSPHRRPRSLSRLQDFPYVPHAPAFSLASLFPASGVLSRRASSASSVSSAAASVGGHCQQRNPTLCSAFATCYGPSEGLAVLLFQQPTAKHRQWS